ncbi:energy transducer TonB [Rubrivirga sp.]|uniref:energy transducer TonB n=1 Tax=Rubrivirga sp. TaxID=1885344 RepID=UPI003C77B60E
MLRVFVILALASAACSAQPPPPPQPEPNGTVLLPVPLDSLASAAPFPASPHAPTCEACKHNCRVSLFCGCLLPPEIVGGYEALLASAEYPEPAPDGGPEGRVVVQFVVGEDGSLSDVEVVHAVHPDLDRAAVEAVRRSSFRPAYSPCHGSVSERYAVPIPYRRSN